MARSPEADSSLRTAADPEGKRWRRRSEARPTEIVAAAAQLFGEHGYAATRMVDVATRAGVTKATVYLYFKDKEHLFESVVRQALEPNLDRAEALVRAFDGSTPALIRMLAMIFQGVLESDYTAIAKMVIAESRTFPELAKLYVDLVVDRGLKMMQSIIQRGIDRGEFRPVPPETTAPLILAPFVMLGVWKHSLAAHSNRMPPPSQVLEQHVEVLIRGLMA